MATSTPIPSIVLSTPHVLSTQPLQPLPTATIAPSPHVLARIIGSGAVNVRRGASTRTRVIRQLQVGEAAEIIGRSSDGAWWLILIDGRRGWVSSDFVQVEGDSAGLPIEP